MTRIIYCLVSTTCSQNWQCSYPLLEGNLQSVFSWLLITPLLISESVLWWSMDRLDLSVCLFLKPLSKQWSFVKMTKLPADMYKIGIKLHTTLKALILALTKHCQFKIIKYCSSYLKMKAQQLQIREYHNIYSGIGI